MFGGKYILIVILILLSLYYCSVYYHHDGPDCTADYDIWMCLTTIPERLRNPWFVKNMRNLCTLNGRYRVLLTIPKTFARTGECYSIPDEIAKMAADPFSKLLINNIDTDYGPITKLFGALSNDSIPDSSLLLICDDDMHYVPNFVVNMSASYGKNPSAIHTYCDHKIEGFKGFMARKSVLKPMMFDLSMPKSCFRIDDDYITLAAQKLSIPVVIVHKSFYSHCHINFLRTKTQPDWSRLSVMDSDRRPLRKQCTEDFTRANTDDNSRR